MCSHTHSPRKDERLLAKVKEPAFFVNDMDDMDQNASYDESAPQVSSARKPRASFSGFSHVVRNFPKRIATNRSKNSVAADKASLGDCNYDFPDIISKDERLMHASSAWDTIDLPPQSRTPCWLRRCVSTRLRPRRQTADTPSRPATAQWAQQNSYCSPLPTTRSVEPAFLDGHSNRAAARPAAAEENEMRHCRWLRRLWSMEQGVRGDSESGIGLDVQIGIREHSLARLDPFDALPKELCTEILSHLDAVSLSNAELVSRQWHSMTNDNLVWKNILFKDFQPQALPAPENATISEIRGQGLGSAEAEQDWKKMWKTRKALHQRWIDSHAAAIYLEGHYDSVYCVQFDEDKIVTGSRDRTVRIWDARTYNCIKVLGVPSRNHPIHPPALTGKKGRRPFHTVTSQQFTVGPSENRPDIYHLGSILCLQYDDELMVTGSSDFACIMWDIRDNWKPVRRVKHHTAGVLDVCFDTKYVLSCSKDTSVCLWDRKTGELIYRLLGHRGPVNAVQLRGNLAVSASGDGVAKLWNLVSGNCVKEFPSKDRGMACVEFSPDSLTIFAGGNDQVIYQFDASTGELIREMSGHSGLVRSLHLDSANGRLVSGSYDNTVRAYDIRDGESLIQFIGWTASWILSAKLDYRRIIATSQDGRIVVMDFGYNLPGTDLLEYRRRPSPSPINTGIEQLRV